MGVGSMIARSQSGRGRRVVEKRSVDTVISAQSLKLKNRKHNDLGPKSKNNPSPCTSDTPSLQDPKDEQFLRA